MNLPFETLSRPHGRQRMRRALQRMEQMAGKGLARVDRAQAHKKEQTLKRLGLEERRSAWGIVLPGVGLLGAGALLGAACVLLFAPGIVSSRMEHRPAADRDWSPR